jgi:hypothetical protein
MAIEIFKVSNPPLPPHTCWDLTRTKHGEIKEYTHFLPESKYELSIRGLAQLIDEKSNSIFKVDILWAMGDSLPGVDSYS